jgi:hypothetical protein
VSPHTPFLNQCGKRRLVEWLGLLLVNVFPLLCFREFSPSILRFLLHNLHHSICFSTIIFTITRGWHNRPGVAAVPIASQTRIRKKINFVAGFPPRRPGFKSGSAHMGFCDRQKWRWGRFSQRTSVSPANLHSICFSTIIFTIITRGWHIRPGVAAVPIATQTK